MRPSGKLIGLSWGRWAKAAPLAVTLAATIWISGMTSWAIISASRPAPPGAFKIDLFDEVRRMEQVLNWALPVGGLGLVACALQQAIARTLRLATIISLGGGLLGAVTCALAFWQGLAWAHGPDFRLWERIWWAIGG